MLNATFNVAQFWDGRAKDLKDQAMGPVENPIEMGATRDVVVERLKNDEYYGDKFEQVYEDGVSFENMADAIAEYERYLVTPSRFDKYLEGDKTALTDSERKGYELFKSMGCTACHQGVGIGGGMFQKLGVVKDYFKARGGELSDADMGRYNVTKKEEDKHVFKVPTLRNVELTPPYFHDASQETLEQAVASMAEYQLGQELKDEQIKMIVAFLKSLTGELLAHAKLPEDEKIPDRTGLAGEGTDKKKKKKPAGATSPHGKKG